MAPTPAKPNAAPVAFANKIKDVDTRNAVLEILKHLGTIHDTLTTIGGVTKPLSTHLDSGNFQLKNVRDPVDDNDAVTLQFLQRYVANFASAFSNTTQSQAGGGSGSTPAPPTAAAPTNHVDIVEAARVSLGINAGSTNAQLFKFAQTVAWNIAALGADPAAGNVGLLHQDSGDGVFYCVDMNDTLACFRICYDNGANIKILTGSYTSQWTQEADVPVTDWRAPTNPASVCP